MGPILNGYGVMGIFISRTRPHVNRVCVEALILRADSPTHLQRVQFPYLDTWGIRGRWGV